MQPEQNKPQNPASGQIQILPKSDLCQQSEYQKKSVFTLLIYFRDGYTKGMKFHSFKQDKRKVNGNYITDNRYALNRLMYLVHEKFKDTYKTAIIYHNKTGRELFKFAYGVMKDNAAINWEYCDNGDILIILPDPKKIKNPMKKDPNEIRYYI